ncbi:hypothetical protein KKC60_00435 [Patescibacteria group bacterium]|nr:hypothetical protein [Patescibacteria group bacterium]
MKKTLIVFISVLFIAATFFNVSNAAENERAYLVAIDKSTDKVVLYGVLPYVSGSLELLMKKGNTDDAYESIQLLHTSKYFGFEDLIAYRHTVENLEPNTEYEFILKLSYQENDDAGVLKTKTQTLQNLPTLTTFSKKYSVPGEKNVFLSGKNINPTKGYHTNDYIFIDFEDRNDSTIDNYRLGGSTDKDEGNRIKLNVPEDEEPRSGKLRMTKAWGEWPGENENSDTNIVELYSIVSEEEFHIICADCMKRTIESKYQDDEYRYLVNSLDYRYGLGESGRTSLEKERAAAQEFRDTMQQRLGRDIAVDALWFLNLFQAWYYGGYSEQDVEKEVLNGPGVVHTSIKKHVWGKTDEYQRSSSR